MCDKINHNMYNYGVARSSYLRRKIINIPLLSEKLAEFMGILYGDGGLTRYQVKVTFNKIDKAYAEFVTRLIKKLFSISASLRKTIFHMLKNLNFSPKLYGNRVYLYKRAEVGRYFKEIGTHNPRYLERYKRFSVTP